MKTRQIASPKNVRCLGKALDHPECVCLDANGSVFAGGEAGQIYRLTGPEQRQVASTGGFVLGIALDADGAVYACDLTRRAVLRISPPGQIKVWSQGTAGHPFECPNSIAFDACGNAYVSDSGDYWAPRGSGRIFRVLPSGETQLFHPGPFKFANGLAIDPTGNWLYVVQSTAPNIVRIPLTEPEGKIQVTHRLAASAVPDGIAFTADGTLVIGCYKPDAVMLGHPDGRVEVLIADPTGELLNRPTNVALDAGQIFIANFGGWHLSVIPSDLVPAPIHRPVVGPIEPPSNS